MKSILRTFVIALATMVASSAYAQMPQGGQRPERPQFSPENMAKMQTEQMAQTLKLSDAQLQAVYELNLANAIEQVKQMEEQRKRQQENSRKWAETEKAQRERNKNRTYSSAARSTDTKKYEVPTNF